MTRSFLFAALLLVAGAASAAIEVADDRGGTILLDRPAQRIVTLAPHLAEMVYAAGAGAKLVGVSSYSDVPDAARRLPVVSNAGRIDFERVIAQRPDLILAWQSGNPVLQLARLERLGYPVLITEPRQFADIPRIVRLIGRVAGSSEAADDWARGFEREIDEMRRSQAQQPPLPVFLEIWHRPMLTVNGAHIFNDALALCGGRNVFSGAKTLTAVVSREQLLGARPEAIVSGGAPEPGAWRGLKAVPAVRAGRIYYVDPAQLHALGPRLLEGTRALCRQLAQARG